MGMLLFRIVALDGINKADLKERLEVVLLFIQNLLQGQQKATIIASLFVFVDDKQQCINNLIMSFNYQVLVHRRK